MMLLNSDARRIPLADGCVDLVVTSPPYGDLRDYKGYVFEHEPIIQELYRVTKDGGVVVWVVADQTSNGSKTGTSFKQALFFLDIGFYLHDEMVYLKNGPAYPSQTRYYQVWEKMFVFSKGKPETYNPLKDRKNRWAGLKWSKKRTLRQQDGSLKDSPWYAEQGGDLGVRFNVWKYNVGHGYHASDVYAHQHPATFPEALARDHVLSWSNPGDLILDPMMGAGTTCKMAKQTGRRHVGIDISMEYCELAYKRVRETQPPLFECAE